MATLDLSLLSSLFDDEDEKKKKEEEEKVVDQPPVVEDVDEKEKPLSSGERMLKRREELEKARTEEDPLFEPDISPIEKFFLGESELDTDEDIGDFSRVVLKTGDKVGEIAKAVAAGGIRGGAFVAQVPHLINKYGLGTIENVGRAAFDNEYLFGGDGWVDYDQLWLGEGVLKDLSDASEAFVKSADKALGVKDFSTAGKIVMYITDFAIPLNVPGKMIKAMKLMGKVSEATTVIIGSDKYVKLPSGKSYKVLEAAKESLTSRKELQPLREKLAKAEANKDWETAAEVSEKILRKKEELLKLGMDGIVASDAKLARSFKDIVKIEKNSDRWWDYSFKVKKKAEKTWTPVATKRQKTGDDLERARREGLDEYEYVEGRIITGADTPKLTRTIKTKQGKQTVEIPQNTFYKQLLETQTTLSAGAIAGTWDSYFEGTEWQDLSYAMALSSIFAKPTTAMKLVDMTASAVLAGKFGIQNWRIPLNTTNRSGAFEESAFSIPQMVYAFGRTREQLKVGAGEVVDVQRAKFTKIARAMAAGVPFYKLFNIDDTKALDIGRVLDEKGRPVKFTELDAIMMYHSKEYKSLETYGKAVLEQLPPEYMESLDSLDKVAAGIIERIEAKGYSDGGKKLIIALDSIREAVAVNTFGNILNGSFKNGDFQRGLFGLSKTDGDNILNIFRIQAQEQTDSIEFLIDAMNDLTKGAKHTAEEFKELKDGASKIVAKLKEGVTDLNEQIKIMADQKDYLYGLKHTFDAKRVLESEDGFNLSKTHFVDDVGETNVTNFGSDVAGNIDKVYKGLEQNKTDLFDKLDRVLEGQQLRANDYVFELENLRNMELNEFKEITSLLKDSNKHLAFGRKTRASEKLPEELSYSETIDRFIKVARYNSLENLPVSELSQKGKQLSSLADEFDLTENLTLSSKIKATRTNMAGDNVDLRATIENAQEHADDMGMSVEDYLKSVLSNLSSDSARGRQFLNKRFNHTMDAKEMHNLRKAHNGWAWRNRNTKPEVAHEIRKSVRSLDNTFSEHGIEELDEANKFYTKFTNTWHDSYLGKRLSKNEDAGKESIADHRLLEIFLKADSVKQAQETFEEMFGDFTRADGSKIKLAGVREDLREKISSTLGYALHETGGGILGSTLESQKIKLNQLRNFEIEVNGKKVKSSLITDKAFKAAENYIEKMHNTSNYRVGGELDRVEKDLNVALKRMTDLQRESINKGIGEQVGKITTSDDLFDFLFPSNRADTYATESMPALEDMSDILGRVRDLTDEAAEEILEYGGRSSVERLESINKRIESIKKNREEISGNRMSVFLKEMYNISPEDLRTGNLSGDQVTKIKGMRDVLISTMIKRSVIRTDRRRPSLDYAVNKELYEGGTKPFEFGKKYKLWKTRAALERGRSSVGLDLNKATTLEFDFNLVDMMNTYDNMAGGIKTIDDAIKRTEGKSSSVFEDFQDLLSAVVMLRGQGAQLGTDTLSAIPSALTTSAALSRVYSGMRGVVSWRYLATEQIVREHQRAKHLMLHKIMSDPDFIENLKFLALDRQLPDKGKFITKTIKGIMTSPAFSRMVVYDPDIDDKPNWNPNPSDVAMFLRNYLVNKPKTIEEFVPAIKRITGTEEPSVLESPQFLREQSPSATVEDEDVPSVLESPEFLKGKEPMNIYEDFEPQFMGDVPDEFIIR
tara:strand:+ start:173 stop:5176 length:5004 start_codon:yes stop_codon:yes gene_type:complete